MNEQRFDSYILFYTKVSNMQMKLDNLHKEFLELFHTSIIQVQFLWMSAFKLVLIIHVKTRELENVILDM